ncbi:MAG: HEAT repeat domain-containing protein [Desulfovibrionaceae bacterium]|nr:HEAT repeat domain-containing protein [Desulfovibrionaceae bacterium]MBF0514850.1 HEAT repeat domain-containing protein [Desulfovibrionaceae bacterium]
MQEATTGKSGVLKGIACVLNASGKAVLYGIDKSADLFGQAACVPASVKDLPEKAKGFFSGGLNFFFGGEKHKIDDKVREYEKKIQKRYFEIGKVSAHSQNMESALQKESIQKLIAEIREYEKEVQRLKGRADEIKAGERKPEAAAPKKAPAEAAYVPVSLERAEKNFRAAIERAVKKGAFPNASAQATFRKIAEDLLDADAEVRLLAAAELGKLANPAAVPVLMEAARFEDPELTSEIVNALINLEDRKAAGLFKELASHPNHRVRMACLRGLYKLAKDDEAGPALITALRDEHAEVRRTAVSFLGWKDYPDAVPALIQCLRDEDASVRKGAVAALANLSDANSVLPLIKVLGDKELEIREKALEAVRSISGEAVAFDANLSEAALDAAIASLIDWWQDKRAGKADTVAPIAPIEPVETAAEAAPAEQAATAAEFGFNEPTAFVVQAEPQAQAGAGRPTVDEIMQLNKADLLALCEKHGLACDPKMTKAELRDMLLKTD